MPEWIKDIIVAVGGGSIALLGILTVFKQLVIKSCETGIETIFQKNIEKYREQLSRSSRSYDMILNKEMDFYEKVDSIFAELVPLAHSIKRCFDNEEHFESEKNAQCLWIYLKQYSELYDKLKTTILIHQAYIPEGILLSYTTLTKTMYDDTISLLELGKTTFDEGNKVDEKMLQIMYDNFMNALVIPSALVKERLQTLSSV